jgi:hypothetical protein
MVCTTLAMVAASACTDDPTSSTDLHPEGPPMIQQVRLMEIAMLPGVSTPIERTVFAFGSHPQANEDEQHAVTDAKVVGNKMRIIFDELLRGNNLEEIECRGVIDDDVYSRVPIGATPDDIARCSGAQDVLPRTCPGSDRLSVCVCQNDAGCGNRTTTLTPKGESVGVLDADHDGAADRNHFISGAVVLSCGGAEVRIDQAGSYWTPSGNQEKPAQGGFDALGPAIVLVTLDAYPTGSECGLTFSPDVVDKDGVTVCAPPDGDRAAGCSPGDTSAVKFTTEPLKFNDALGASRMAWPRMMDIQIQANAPLDPSTLANITMTEGAGTPYTQFTATLSAMGQLRTIVIHAVAGFAPSTPYTITVPSTVTDAYHKSAPQPFVLSFTTAAN